MLTERHGGREDFSVTSKAAMLDVFDNIIVDNIAALAGGGIALWTAYHADLARPDARLMEMRPKERYNG